MERKTNWHFIFLYFINVFFLTLFGAISQAHEGHDIAKAASIYIEISARIEEYQSDDFRNKKSERHYFATDIESLKKYEIHFDKKAPKHFKTGNIIKLSGLLIGSDLYLNSTKAESFAALNLNGSTDSTVTATGSAAAVTGVQNTLVIAIDSNDSIVSCGKTQISDLMFDSPSNSVNYLYQDVSNAQLSFSGVVYDHVKINANSSGLCDYSSWSSAAEQALSAQGINTSGYNKKVYVLPPNNGCGWAGLGMIGASGAWINGSYCGTADIYAHELGHNLNLQHARTPTSEYGDYSDFMGIGGVGLRGLNGPHKAFMGWTPTSKIINGGIGTYTIAPLELNPSSTSLPQIVKISKPDSAEFYYLSFRRQIGYDVRLSSSYYDKLNVHSSAGGGYSTFHVALGDSQSFSDSVNGLTISVLSHDENSISFRIDGVCNQNTPKLTISPATQGGSAGQILNYNLQIQNLDSPYCPASQFDFHASLPPELQSQFSVNSVSVAAGLSATATVSVNSLLGSNSGTYNFQITASDPNVAIHNASANANYVIDAQAPSTPINLVVANSKSKTNLTWSASTDNVAVSGYEIMRNGVVVATVQGTYYSMTLRKGTYTFQVRARDAAGNLSAWSNLVTFKK